MIKALKLIFLLFFFSKKTFTLFQNIKSVQDKCCQYQYHKRSLDGCCMANSNDVCCKPLIVYESDNYITCKKNNWSDCKPASYRIGGHLFHQIKDQVLEGIDYENGSISEKIYNTKNNIYYLDSKQPYYYPSIPLRKYRGQELSLFDGEDGKDGESTFAKGSQGGSGGDGGEAAKDFFNNYLGDGGDGGDGGTAFLGGGGGHGGHGGPGIYGGDGGDGGHSYFDGKGGDGGKGGLGQKQGGKGGDGGNGYYGADAGHGGPGGDGGDAYFGGKAGDGGPGGDGGDAIFGGIPGKKGPGGRRDGKFYPFGKDFGTLD